RSTALHHLHPFPTRRYSDLVPTNASSTTTTEPAGSTVTELASAEVLAKNRALDLAPTSLLPEGYYVPTSRWVHPSIRFRELLATEPYVFAPGVFDPFGAELALYHR